MLKSVASLVLCAVMIMNLLRVPVFADTSYSRQTISMSDGSGFPEGMGDTIVEEEEPNDPRLDPISGKVVGDPNQIKNGDTVTGFLWFSSEYPEIRDLWDQFEFVVPEHCEVRVYVVTQYGDKDLLNTGFSVSLSGSGKTIAEDAIASDSGESDYPNCYFLEEELDPGTYKVHMKGTYASRNRYKLYLSMDICTHKNASTVVINPTCTTEGYTVYICPDCHTTTHGDYVPALLHDEKILEGKPATCTETGLTFGKICSRCGLVFFAQEIIEKKEHTGEWTMEQESTCTQAGERYRICSVCGQNEQETIAANGHSFGNWITDQEAACTTDGAKYRICSACSQKEWDIIAATGHHFGEWIVDQELTCLQDGECHRICSVCDHREVQKTEAVGAHSFGDWIQEQEQSCAQDTIKYRDCSVCGESETQTLPALAHTFTVIELTKGPTPENTGLLTIKCAVCESGKMEILPVSMDTVYQVPENVTHIADLAFDGYQYLTGVTFPDSLSNIGRWAFRGCSKLTNITFGDGDIRIGEQAFGSCGNLDKVTFGKGKTTIAEEAFSECNNLINLRFGDGAVSIGAFAFFSCNNLYNVVFGDGPVSIDRQAFTSCKWLTKLVFGNGLTTIGQGAFIDCNHLTQITFPDSVTDIGYSIGAAKMQKLCFLGAPPSFEKCFEGMTATAYYPARDTKWTQTVRDSAGGNITWIACNHDLTGGSCGTKGACKNCGAEWYVHNNTAATCEVPMTCRECGLTRGDALGHSYENGVCKVCEKYQPGDINHNGQITQEDAIYLIWHALFPEMYPVPAGTDLDADGTVDAQDAVVLLWHVLFPTEYPL